jgi:hypothetical protein
MHGRRWPASSVPTAKPPVDNLHRPGVPRVVRMCHEGDHNNGQGWMLRRNVSRGVIRPMAWLKWNGKKILKAVLGADYPGLTTCFARMERGVGTRRGN